MAEAVIGGTLVAVLQDLVGLVDFLELTSLEASPGFLSGCHFIASLRKAALSFDIVGGPFDFQGFVVAALGGHQSNPPEVLFMPEGRITRKMQPSA